MSPIRRLTGPSRTGVFLATLALVLVALFLPGWPGGVLLVVLAIGAAVLLSRTWPALRPPARALRLIILGLLVAIAVSRF